jgi:hypothetical protein
LFRNGAAIGAVEDVGGRLANRNDRNRRVRERRTDKNAGRSRNDIILKDMRVKFLHTHIKMFSISTTLPSVGMIRNWLASPSLSNHCRLCECANQKRHENNENVYSIFMDEFEMYL